MMGRVNLATSRDQGEPRVKALRVHVRRRRGGQSPVADCKKLRIMIGQLLVSGAGDRIARTLNRLEFGGQPLRIIDRIGLLLHAPPPRSGRSRLKKFSYASRLLSASLEMTGLSAGKFP